MLKPVRVDAGLGDPPEEYTNNDVEAANFMIKHNLQFDAKKPHEFINNVKSSIATENSDKERAVFGKGPYEVAEQFQHYFVGDGSWGRMSHAQRRAKVAKFLSAEMDEVNEERSDEEKKLEDKPSTITISPEEVGINTVPHAVLATMFQKANKLLSSPELIVPQPGSTDGSYIVHRHSNKIYCVKPGKGGALVCDRSCFNRSTGICEHTLAVAKRKGTFKEFLNCFKRGKKGASITALALKGGPKNAGKKLSGTKRTNKKKSTIENYEDLLEGDQIENECNLNRPPSPVLSQQQRPESVSQQKEPCHPRQQQHIQQRQEQRENNLNEQLLRHR
eukprot:Seg621.1 transcript_id=Seg621.1/GoldUCD/mRNA.D3Y31 product="hypothetical protein" protein_id=Seg621.1/GoldUCD/D3Y31